MAVSFLPQAQIRAGNPLLDLAQLNQGLASVQRSNELQADRAMREQQMAADEKQQNRLMALREQQMAQSAQQNAIENRRADETMSMRRAEFSAQQQARQREMDMQKAQKAARLAGMVSGNQERWDALRRMVPDINEDLPADIASDPVLGPQALQAMVFGPTNERDQLEMEKLRAEIDAAKNSGPFKDNKQRFDATTSLRKEFSSLSGNFRDLQGSLNNIQAAVATAKSNPSAAGLADVSLIYNYMKMLDPGSVVREGEFATAEEAAGVPTKLLNLYNKLVGGERLSNEQRDNYLKTSTAFYNKEAETFNRIRDQMRSIAEKNQLDPSQVLLDFAAPPDQPVVTTPDEYNALPSGATYRDAEGNLRQKAR